MNGSWCAACGKDGPHRCTVCGARWCRACLFDVMAMIGDVPVFRGVSCRVCGFEWALDGEDARPTSMEEEVTMPNTPNPTTPPQNETDEQRRAREQREAEQQLASVTADLAEVAEQAIASADELLTVTEREAKLIDIAAQRGDRISELELRVAGLEHEDRDAAKLRRRLADRGRELDQAHARIRELEAGLRAAAASEPMIDWRRHG